MQDVTSPIGLFPHIGYFIILHRAVENRVVREVALSLSLECVSEIFIVVLFD
jgi:hypothetical protein